MRAQWQRFFGLNVSQIDPLLFVGGGFSTRQWPLLHALGVRAVLSLQAERADSFAGTPPERVLRLHVIDYTAPSLEQLREGVAFLADAHAAGLPVLVHCRAGVGRAPTTAAAYLMMHHGMSAEAALARLRAARPIIGLNLLQISRLREWERTLRSAAQHVPE
jgi:protein-tyrosine phosphatase